MAVMSLTHYAQQLEKAYTNLIRIRELLANAPPGEYRTIYTEATIKRFELFYELLRK